MERMIVGTMEVTLYIGQALSLKDKRKVVRSLKDKIRNKFNVSVAEVDAQDMRQKCVLGMAWVANDSNYLESKLAKVVEFIRNSRKASVVNYYIETF